MTSEFLSSNCERIVTWQSLTLLHSRTLNILPVHYITHLSVIVTSLTFLLQLHHSPVCYSYITHLSVTVTSLTCLLQLHHSPVCYNYITHLSVTVTSLTCLLYSSGRCGRYTGRASPGVLSGWGGPQASSPAVCQSQSVVDPGHCLQPL